MLCFAAVFVELFALAELRPLARVATTSRQEATVLVPFVGCKSSRVVEPMEVPKEFYAEPYRGKSLSVRVPAQVAQRLAYYRSERSLGVLAPRGWHCIALYDSRGATLYVSPQAIDTIQGLSRISVGFTGQTIEIDYVYGGTSGRYQVARVIARVFPNRRAFVENVIKRWSQEGIGAAGSFPVGPYPNDRLIYRNDDMVEFETPADTEGLGTMPTLMSTLKKGSDPIRGVAILIGNTPDLVLLSLRVPPQLADLSSTIIQQVERDATRSDTDSRTQ
jgi:hypothetical protein